jgi:hypothetical protein
MVEAVLIQTDADSKVSSTHGQPSGWLDRYAGRIAVASAAVAAAVTLYYLWLSIAAGYVDVPLVDQMRYLNPTAMLQLWKHHNGVHLIFFPRLIFWIDDRFFAGSNQFNIAVLLLIQAGLAGVFVLLARMLGFRSVRATAFVTGLSVVLAFATCQHESFVWGWEVQYVLVDAAFAFGAYALARFAATSDPRWLAAAVAGGLVSLGSLGNGIAALPLLVVLALAYRRRGAALVLLLVAVIGTWAYFATNDPTPPPGSQFRGGVFPYLAIYGLVFLGNPLTQTFVAQVGHPIAPLPRHFDLEALWIGFAAAAASVLAIVSVAVRVRNGRVSWRGPNAASAEAGGLEAWYADLALVAVILFAYAAMVITTYGRSWFGLHGALAERYASPVLPMLLATLLLLGHAWRANAGPARMKSLAVVAIGLGLLAFAVRGGAQMREVTDQRTSNERTVMALAVGIEDNSLLPVMFIKPETMVKGFARLRAVHKSLFSEPWVQAVGQPLDRVAPMGVGGRCEGAVNPLMAELDSATDAHRPLDPPYGEVWAPHDQHPTPTIVLVDKGGRVTGIGRVEATIADIKGGGIRANHKLVPWQGELLPGTAGDLTAYLLINDGRKACPFGKMPAIASAGGELGQASQAQVPLVAQSVAIKGVFPLGGTGPSGGPDIGAPDRPGPVYGSWAGADANKGSLVLRYGAPPARAVAILTPVVQGPGQSSGLGLRIRLEPSGQVLAMAAPNGLNRWRWWRVPLPANAQGQQVEVEAVDSATGPAQWLAVGASYAEVAAR